LVQHLEHGDSRVGCQGKAGVTKETSARPSLRGSRLLAEKYLEQKLVTFRFSGDDPDPAGPKHRVPA